MSCSALCFVDRIQPQIIPNDALTNSTLYLHTGNYFYIIDKEFLFNGFEKFLYYCHSLYGTNTWDVDEEKEKFTTTHTTNKTQPKQDDSFKMSMKQ